MQKLSCFLKIIWLIIQHKLSKLDVDFWYWLYDEVSRAESKYHEDVCLIKFLLIDAIERDDLDEVRSVWGRFKFQLLDVQLNRRCIAAVRKAVEEK